MTPWPLQRNQSARFTKLKHQLTILLCLTAAVFYGLSFLHLKADFPNFSPWNDWSKTTDEGWYAGGAVHRAVFGHWITPGGFNPVVAMPVWPVIAHVWFRVAGFGMLQLRVACLLLFGVSLLLFFRLVRQAAGTMYAALAVALLTTNPFVYSFTRLALLEQVMLFWLFLGWTFGGAAARRRGASALMLAALAGLSVTAMVFSKTTGAVLVPAILWYQWFSAPAGENTVARVRNAASTVVAATASWLLYDMLVIRHHSADYRLVFSVNNYRVHMSIVPREAWATLRDGMWIDPALYVLALFALVLAALVLHELWRQPLFTAAVLAGAAYLAFICYHANLQPRYYLVAAPSVVVVAVLALRAMTFRSDVSGSTAYAAGVVTVYVMLGATLLVMSARTLRYAMHAQYSYLTAMDGVGRAVRATGDRALIVANPGDNISLFTGLQSICEEYSSVPPDALLTWYQPGWYASVLGGRPTPMLDAIQRRYRMEERARYEIFDDPERHTLVLYRLVTR